MYSDPHGICRLGLGRVSFMKMCYATQKTQNVEISLCLPLVAYCLAAECFLLIYVAWLSFYEVICLNVSNHRRLHQASTSMLQWCLRHSSHWKQWSCSKMGCNPILEWLYLCPSISIRAMLQASSNHWHCIDTDTWCKRVLKGKLLHPKGTCLRIYVHLVWAIRKVYHIISQRLPRSRILCHCPAVHQPLQFTT